MFGLEGKRVLVTGASRGIGLAAAAAFARAGARLALHHRSGAAEAQAVPHEAMIRADFAERGAAEEVVRQATEALGGLNVLVNNAGHMLGRIPLADATDGDVDAVFDLNARSTVAAIRAALPALREAKGNVVNVSSISARSGGSPGSSLYSASKAFVSSLTRSLAAELAPDGIRVNAVSPGTIMTRFHEVYSTPEKLEATRAKIPLRRLGTPEDCAGAFLFLASDQLAGYVTGQVIEVNGGQWVG